MRTVSISMIQRCGSCRTEARARGEGRVACVPTRGATRDTRGSGSAVPVGPPDAMPQGMPAGSRPRWTGKVFLRYTCYAYGTLYAPV